MGELLQDKVAHLAEEAGFQVVAKADLPRRSAVPAPVPAMLHKEVKMALASDFPRGLYAHQAEAIQAVLEGSDICIATPTASGKSHVFIAAAADLLKREPSSKVVAFYPARALIQDQIQKWKAFVERLGLRVGYIDGGVPMAERLGILRSSHVVLFTPDVVHAWLMSRLGEPLVRDFMHRIRLLVLDEAHVYEGVFGTNMAYFLRRFQVAAGPHRLICSTATVGDPARFIWDLTGREVRVWRAEDDRSDIPAKSIMVARPAQQRLFDGTVHLLTEMAQRGLGRFLAFSDSRRAVEQLVAACHRAGQPEDDRAPDEADEELPAHEQPAPLGGGSTRILPYRAGYETGDRNLIQEALASGDLAGVVSTSAMELGIDIGEINVILLLNAPPSMKAFWQRMGRGGRKTDGVCLLLDDRGTLPSSDADLVTYMRRALEPSWLYLANRYIQYANVLCAAVEVKEAGKRAEDLSPFRTLPEAFHQLLENELNPTQTVPQDLYLLKQEALAGAHHVFPVRTGLDQSFQVSGPFDQPLGNLGFSQVLREAYPGGIYYYMARPYRVTKFSYRDGRIKVKRERYWTTRPDARVMVFPKFMGGVHTLYRSDRGFLAECEMQVSEQVLGFIEQRGRSKLPPHRYGPDSPYYRQELTRFLQTTGVCWYFDGQPPLSTAAGELLLEAFCLHMGVQERDVGLGRFHAHNTPFGEGPCGGLCIYDAAYGSLRLTQQFAEQFEEVAKVACALAQSEDNTALLQELERLSEMAAELKRSSVSDAATMPSAEKAEEEWREVIAPRERAMLVNINGTQEVEVVTYRYTPQGLRYELVHPDPGTKWSVPAESVFPIHGQTKMLRVNLYTGEERPLP